MCVAGTSSVCGGYSSVRGTYPHRVTGTPPCVAGTPTVWHVPPPCGTYPIHETLCLRGLARNGQRVNSVWSYVALRSAASKPRCVTDGVLARASTVYGCDCVPVDAVENPRSVLVQQLCKERSRVDGSLQRV